MSEGIQTPNLTKTMKHPPTCHNCTTYGTPKCPDCAFKKYDTLCIEHPRIREYLMQDALEYLESVEAEFQKHFLYAEGKEYEIWGTALNRTREAIALIRDGVRK